MSDVPMYVMFLSHDDETPTNSVHGARHPAEEARDLIESAGGRVIE